MPRSIHRTSSSHFRFTVLLAVIFLAGSGNWRDGMAQQRSPQQRVGDGEKTVLLYGQQKERETTEVRAVITVRGKLTEREEVKAGPVPMEAVAQVVYDEHILPIGSEHTSAEPLTSARFYRQAQAQLKVGDHGQTTKLAAGAELQLATYGADGLRIFSPTRPLTRDELELLELPGSSLLIGQLLPNQQTSIGQTWTVASDILAAILSIDAVTANNVTFKLTSSENGIAIAGIGGQVTGSVDGVITEVKLTGELRYDEAWGHVCWLQLQLRESRRPGKARPGLEALAELKMLIRPAEKSPELSAALAKGVAKETAETHELLKFTAVASGFECLHNRSWHVLQDDGRNCVLRCVEHGEALAHCRLARLPQQAPGKRVGLPELQQDIQKSLGERFGKFVNAQQWRRNDGYEVLQAIVQGTVQEVPVQWSYYHLTDEQGNSVALQFTTDSQQSQRVSSEERVFVNSLRIQALQPIAETADTRGHVTGKTSVSVSDRPASPR